MLGIPAAHRLVRSASKENAEVVRLVASLLSSDPPSGPELDGLPTFVLCDVVEALFAATSDASRRTSRRLRLGEEPLEIGIRADGQSVLLSLFSGGAAPTVFVFEERIARRELSTRLRGALDLRLAHAETREQDRIALALRLIEASDAARVVTEGPLRTVEIEPTPELGFSLGAEVTLQPGQAAGTRSNVMRADLFSLLFRGRLRVMVEGHVRELAELHPFLIAEQLCNLALGALEHHALLRSYHRRLSVGGATLAVRLNVGSGEVRDSVSVTFARNAGRALGATYTFPNVELATFAQAVVAFGRALTRTLMRHDRSQVHNLRLVELRARLRELGELVRELGREDSKLNASPESYRAYALPEVAQPRLDISRMRIQYAEMWRAAVPGIDLSAMFLANDTLFIQSARELCALSRESGNVRWKRPTARGTSVLTPVGVARFESDGNLRLHDFQSGEVAWQKKLEPRTFAPVTGAVVAAPGLPRLIVVSEGKRSLACVDLETGELRWRHVARRASTFRLRRLGRLVIVTSGESAISALDVLTGEIVWRVCDRLRFVTPVTVDRDALFAVAGEGALGGTGNSRLYSLDPWSGQVRFTVDLPPRTKLVTGPLVGSDFVTLAAYDSRGTSITTFDRRTGALVHTRDVCAGAAAAMLVDETVVLNSESGELCAVDQRTGELRYRHMFEVGAEGDRPRRLEPVLRSGALFVPQTNVVVLRPFDGTIIGRVPSELIPDLVRIDERCDVYVAEESGHVSAFGARARLALVT